MPPDPETTVVLDASVLINFLAVDRAPCLASIPGCRLVITDHVRAEITSRYPDQLARCDALIDSGGVEVVSITGVSELTEFATLTDKGLGVGESASISAAHHRGFELAIDDKVARKRATELNPSTLLRTTQSLTCTMIDASLLSIEEADEMLLAWREHHRFCLKIASFREVAL